MSKRTSCKAIFSAIRPMLRAGWIIERHGVRITARRKGNIVSARAKHTGDPIRPYAELRAQTGALNEAEFLNRAERAIRQAESTRDRLQRQLLLDKARADMRRAKRIAI